MDRQRRRSRLTAYGRTSEFRKERVPVAPIREHIAALMAYAGLERIADTAQVSRSAVLDAYYGPRGATKRARRVNEEERTISASHASRILSVTSDQIEAAFVEPSGTVRRLRALVAIGYTETELSAHLGMLMGNFSPLIHGRRPRVTAATYAATRALFDQLWNQPLTGAKADRARRLARRNGWFGPLAWDDIDDPGEQPNAQGPAADGPLIDEMAIDLALSGVEVKLSSAERRVAVQRLHAERWSDGRIAETIGANARTVLRIRQELGLETFDQTELRQRGAA